MYFNIKLYVTVYLLCTVVVQYYWTVCNYKCPFDIIIIISIIIIITVK